MLEHGIKPVYVFDGKPPQLKSGEVCVLPRCRLLLLFKTVFFLCVYGRDIPSNVKSQAKTDPTLA